MGCVSGEHCQQGLQERDQCWVCLEEGCARKDVTFPCKCPNPVHPTCLARWQLQKAGTREETHCRFCDNQLPDWRSSLAPPRGLSSAPPVMTVAFHGQVHDIPVHSGPGGYAAFTADIRRLFGISQTLQMHLSFDCAEPATGQPLNLSGNGAFNAAVHCAAIAAARRATKRSRNPGFLRQQASRLLPWGRHHRCEEPASANGTQDTTAATTGHGSAARPEAHIDFAESPAARGGEHQNMQDGLDSKLDGDDAVMQQVLGSNSAA